MVIREDALTTQSTLTHDFSLIIVKNPVKHIWHANCTKIYLFDPKTLYQLTNIKNEKHHLKWESIYQPKGQSREIGSRVTRIISHKGDI